MNATFSRGRDPLCIALDAVGYPKTIRFSLPDSFFQQSTNEFALIFTNIRILLSYRARDSDTKFPKQSSLSNARNILRAGRPLRIPVLELNPDVPVQQFSVNDGRHRIQVLDELKVHLIPVAVPWHRADEFLEYLK